MLVCNNEVIETDLQLAKTLKLHKKYYAKGNLWYHILLQH